MKPNENARCAVCGKEILPGQGCIWSKPRGQKPIFCHLECYKTRKESKKHD